MLGTAWWGLGVGRRDRLVVIIESTYTEIILSCIACLWFHLWEGQHFQFFKKHFSWKGHANLCFTYDLYREKIAKKLKAEL